MHAVDVERAEVTSSVGQYPWAMSQSGDGTTLFVSNANSSSISVVDVATFTVRSTVDTAPAPGSMVAAPDGRSAYFSGNADYDQPYESVFRVDLASGTVAEMFRSRIGAVNHVALNASGSRLLVNELADPQGGGPYGVSIVDLGTDDVVSTIDVDDLGRVRPGPGNDMYILEQSVLTVVDPDAVVIERSVPLGPIGTDDYRTFSADGGTMYVVGADTRSIRSVPLDL